MGITLVDAAALPWQNGIAYLKTLDADFLDNLGPTHLRESNFARYWQKALFRDAETTRRLDLVRVEGPYEDLTHCYHDSAEEAMILDGSLTNDGEGTLTPGDYFWRPPGWVHAGHSEHGATFLLGFEGDSAECGPVSRCIRPAEEAGLNVLYDDDDLAAGSRGRIRRLETGVMAWQPGEVFARAEGGDLSHFDVERCRVKVLSKDWTTGRQTLLMSMLPGYSQTARIANTHALQVYVLAGEVQRTGGRLRAGCLLNRPAGTADGAWLSKTGARLFIKSDGWLDMPAAS